ncbi:MAG: right-handed parallel beta-helix repeat-containing protein, partial [Bacteroidia bacterium]|nr:right-handed parallel beta-helix repeat-containing protein [Bacteroidia bacterium]
GLIRGIYPGTINIVSDGGNKSVSVSMSVPNHSPIITSTPIDSTEIDIKYTYNVIATDGDNDNLTYSFTTAPSGMGINSGTGVITWTPILSGTYPVVISVNDGNGGIVTQNFSLKVKGTYIISDISEDTIWRKSGNPYVLANSIVVNTGITLTIEQGVKVIFRTLKALQIDGTLIARGTDTENIIFTSNAFGPKAGDWGHILFSDSSIDAAFDRDGNYTGGSILEYCVVEYAGGANVDKNGAVRTFNAYPLINYCTIRNNKGAGIMTWWDWTGVNPPVDSIKITNNTVSNNTTGGINVDWVTCTIYNNNINNNSGGGINVNGYSAAISFNIINKNNGGGINVSGGSSPFTISNNIISNNTANNGGGILFYSNSSTISNNIISNNAAIYNGGGIYSNGWSISYTGNIIINNTAQNAAAVYYSSNSYLNFKYNTITGNISTGTKPIYTIYIDYNNSLFNYNNIFSNTATDTDIYELWNGTYNLNAENNWWGTNSVIEIQAKIYDWQDLPSQGKVDYTPWLASINIDAPISAPAELSAVSGTSGKILLSWPDNPESDISGYIVHWGTEPGSYQNSINVGSTTGYTITGLSKGTYYIALTAYDIYYSGDKDDPDTIVNENQTGGNESWYSDEKIIEIIDGSKGELALTATTLFGTTADEKGTSVSILGNTLFLSGITSANANDGIAARYLLPLSNGAVPLWNASWPIYNGSDEFYGAAASNKGVFLAGNSYTRTSDTAGGKEVKGIVVRFPLNGATGLGYGGSIWDKQTPSLPGAFSYSGTETLFGITGNQNFIYTTGGGQQNCANGGRMHISKLDTTGDILWTKTDGAEMQNNAFSVGNAITTLYNNIYVAGTNRDDGTKGRPYLRKYDTSGTLIWSRKTTSLIGTYNGINAFNGAIYAVGSTLDSNYQPLDFIIEKWDETGNLRWSKQYDRDSAEDVLYSVVGFGPYIYAVGSTGGNTSGGADAVILKINPVTGDLISSTLWGGNLDDIARGIATDGNDLYITGETKSFGEGGNDVMLLRYSVQ